MYLMAKKFDKLLFVKALTDPKLGKSRDGCIKDEITPVFKWLSYKSSAVAPKFGIQISEKRQFAITFHT